MTNETHIQAWQCGADLVVNHLEQQGVKQVFGIPGAKIDRVFNSLEDSSIQTIVVRHEANAAFMAAAIGRLTGKAGVALVTSGPGCANLVTGLATATSEGDPVVALGGAVKRADSLKITHQSMDTVSIFRPITKFSAEVTASAALSEVLGNAFRTAEFGRPGAAFQLAGGVDIGGDGRSVRLAAGASRRSAAGRDEARVSGQRRVARLFAADRRIDDRSGALSPAHQRSAGERRGD